MIDYFVRKYSFLSNFYLCDIEYDGKSWRSSEHLYQALKSNNQDFREYVRRQPTPKMAKRAGNLCEFHGVPVMRPRWNDMKYAIMGAILIAKFSNPELKKMLLDTGDEKLVEGNMWCDNYWGDCYCFKCRDITGKNGLGELLMETRNFYRSI